MKKLKWKTWIFHIIGLEVVGRNQGRSLSHRANMKLMCFTVLFFCKHMSTQMISNLKILRDQATSSDPKVLTLQISDLSQNRHLVYGKCSQKHLHTVIVKHILRYGLKYTSRRGIWPYDFTSSDWMGNVVDRKSISGYCFSLGSAMISWSSRKQSSVAQSTAKAEYIAASVASREAV